MKTEYEATFPDIDKDLLRERLKIAGATCVKPEFLQKRVVFHLPDGHEITGSWVRVRDEGDQITMSLKVVNGDKIQDQKEIFLKVDNFNEAEHLLMTLGCRKKSYQETKRELWLLDSVEIAIDEWPYLNPIVEVEGESEERVKDISQKLGFDYSKALFGAVDVVYRHQYPHLTSERINNATPRIVFDEINPFLG